MSLEIDPRKIRPYRTRFWGRTYLCKPAFVDKVLGDGNILIGLQPLNTRPQYYMIRVDSRWHLSGCRTCEDDCPDYLVEHLEEIYEAIEDHYGEVNRVRELNEDLKAEGVPKKDWDSEEWPVMDLDVGASWFTFYTPEKYLSDAAYCLRAEVTRK